MHARTVLITGCSSGFGRGMVDEFLSRGWTVLATLRQAEARRELFDDLLARYPEKLRLLELDVTSEADREAAVATIGRLGGLDCLVSNAGYGTFGALEDFSETTLRQVFETNFFGATLLIRSCLPYLRHRKGSVVIVTSIFGVNGFPLTSTYCATKFALEGLAESLHFELAPHGVDVSVIEPGASVTKFGSNVVWGNEAVPAYQTQTQNYHRLKKKIAAGGKDITPKVARLAADLAERKRLGFRHLVGADARFGYYFRRYLPDWLGLPLSKLLYWRLFGTPEASRDQTEGRSLLT